MIDRRETPNSEEPSIVETARRAALKALDLRKRPSHEAWVGAIPGGYFGAAWGPIGALVGMASGAVIAKVSVELAQRHGRIIRRRTTSA